MKYIPRVLRYLLPYWRLGAASVVFTLLTVLASLVAPWPMKLLIDNVLGTEPLPGILTVPLGSLFERKELLLVFAVVFGFGITLAENALTVLNNYVQTKLQQRIVLDFRSDMFQHALRLSLTFHDQSRAGGLIYAVNYQADEAAGLIMTMLPLAQSALTLIGMFWIALQLDVVLALLSLVVVPFLYYSVGYYTTHIQTRLRTVKGMEGDTLTLVHEAMSLLRVIVAFGRERHELDRFHDLGERALDARVKLTVRQTLFSLAVNVTTAVGVALVLGYGAYRALQGHLTAGELIVMVSYIHAVYQPLESLSFTVGSLQDKFISMEMAYNVMDAKPEIQDTPGAVDIGRARGDLVFDQVSFSYPQRVDTLKSVSFQLQAGQIAAIVGPTGAGKTTLVSLIPRFYDPQQGHILLDGQDIRTISLRSLRDQISVVLQEPLLFAGTIADNIRYGRLDATMDEVMEAAKSANAHDFIMRLPSQYDTLLGERGVRLSGGERQRICIARAFLKDAPILILDEPTSAIDSRTESVILDALDELMQDRTTLMIAHRLSTVRNADIILCMDHGQLVEYGTHDELITQKGLYKQLYEMHTAQADRRSRRLQTLSAS